MPAYTMPEHGQGFPSSGHVRGLGSCVERSNELRGCPEQSLTLSKIGKVLCGVTEDLSRDISQEIKAWIPPQVSPMTTGAPLYTAQPFGSGANSYLGVCEESAHAYSGDLFREAALCQELLNLLTVMCKIRRARSWSDSD